MDYQSFFVFFYVKFRAVGVRDIGEDSETDADRDIEGDKVLEGDRKIEEDKEVRNSVEERNRGI